MKRLRCMMGRHRWRTIRIERQTAYECRHCKARDFGQPRGYDLDDVNRAARENGRRTDGLRGRLSDPPCSMLCQMGAGDRTRSFCVLAVACVTSA